MHCFIIQSHGRKKEQQQLWRSRLEILTVSYMIACCASKRSLLTKLLVGIVKENYKLSDQIDFYGMVSPFVAFY